MQSKYKHHTIELDAATEVNIEQHNEINTTKIVSLKEDITYADFDEYDFS